MELCGAPRPTRAPFPHAARSVPPPFGGPPRSRAPPAPAPPARGTWRRREPAGSDYVNMVHVSGFPTYTQPQDLAHAFRKFGAVTVDRLVENMAALAFATPAEAKSAIQASGTVNIYGEFLTVKQYNKGLEHVTNRRKEPPKSKQKAVTVDPAGLPWAGDFHMQLDALLNAVRLSAADIQRLAALYQDLEAALQDAWPGCRAIPFGSVTTGLGVKSSDADCFVLLPPGAPAAAANAVPRARRLLAQHPRIFSELLAIPRANTPIVKCYHLPTRTHCDVSFKTPLGAQNSKLISFLLYADPRLIPVAVTLKYYASVHDLTGTGKLTNYALTMLIIFYLQQRNMIPPVEWLQRDRNNDFIVDFWNTGFMDNHARLPPNQCGASIAELLGGFFEFYTTFDFDLLAVCPYLGRAIPKDLFKTPNLLPPEFERYKVNVTTGVSLPIRFNTAMCVQDPFEQCHNVASPVTTRLSADIRTFFKFAAEVYAQEKLVHCRNFLRTILLEKPKLARGKSSPEYRISLYPAYVNTITDPDWKSIARNVVFLAFETMLKVQLKSVPAPQDRNKKDAANDKDAAGTQAKETPVNEQANDTRKEQENSKKQNPTVKEDQANSTAKTEEANSSTKEVNSNSKKDAAPGAKKEPENTAPKKERSRPKREKEKYTGSFTRTVWKRKQYAKLFSVMGFKFQEREQKITEEILKFDKNVINSEFQLMITFKEDPRTVMVSVKYISGEPTYYREFGKFMLSTMQQWFMTLLRPHCNPSNKRERKRKPRKEKVEKKEAPAVAPAPPENLDSDDDSAEIIEQPPEVPSDTDSVSSYEDERIDPNLKPQQTDKSQSDDSNPSDANKENVNDVNDKTKKLHSPDKNRNDKVIPQIDDEKPDCGDKTQAERKTEP